MKPEVKQVAAPLGVGLAACAACCAGPLLGVIGGLGLAGSVVALGLGATLLAVLAVVTGAFALAVRRRRVRQTHACQDGAAIVPPVTVQSVPAPTRRNADAVSG